MSLRPYLVLFFAGVLVCCTSALAENVPSSKQWDQLASNEAFSYQDEKEGYTKPREQNYAFLEKLMQVVYLFFSSGLGLTIIWVCFFLLVAWVIYKIFFDGNTFLYGKRKTVESDHEADELNETNWEAELQNALHSGNTRLVVRYSYMVILKLLEQHQLIQYQNGKTNYEYYKEINDDLKLPFKQMSRQYEYAWYGNYKLSDTAYKQYMQTFEKLKKTISH